MKLTTSVCSVFNKATTCKKNLEMDIDTVDKPDGVADRLDGVIGDQKVEEEEKEYEGVTLLYSVELPNLMLDYWGSQKDGLPFN